METKLISKLARIMGEITHIEKNGWNAFHKYAYVLEQDVLDVVRKKLLDYGIFIKTDIISVSVLEMSKDKGGMLTTIQAKHTLIDVESGETLEVMGAGQGEDKGDKGIYKAITGDVKYFLTKLFLIPTGNDPEGFDGKRESAGKKQPQAQTPPPPPAPAKPKPATAPAQPVKAVIPPNRFEGRLINVLGPATGTKNGVAWKRWDIETKDFKASAFSSSVADVAVNALSDGNIVEMFWKAITLSTGEVKNNIESIHIIG